MSPCASFTGSDLPPRAASHTAGALPSRRISPPTADLLQTLESAVPGGVRSRASDRLAMAHDASHYLLTPDAVVNPTCTEQVAALMRAGTGHRLPLTFRSGGTSLSGQASTGDILVDTRRHFRDIEILDGGARVRVQPGATVRQVNARLAAYKRKLGPDPASEAACTIGGVVANNSSGMACGTEFNTYKTLDSVVIVLPSGTVIDTADVDADAALRHLEPALHQGLLRLRDRVRGNPTSRQIIETLYSIKNTMGYGVNSFLDFDHPIDILTHLVIGSEGTLAFVAEATFRTIPVKPKVSTGLLVFNHLRDATAALPELVGTGLATIELLDSRSLRVAQRDPAADATLRDMTVHNHAALLVEFQEACAETLNQRTELCYPLLDQLPLSTPAALSSDPRTRAALWHIRKGLYATVAGNRPSGTTALLEDIAVPVAKLLDTCEELVGLFGTHGYEDSVIFGHAKDGNIHFLLNENFDRPDQLDRYQRFTEEMVALVLGNDGTLKAEHGTGRIMAPFVRRQYGDELYEVMCEVKRLLDPANILNPGVLLNEDPTSHVRDLKTAVPVEEEVDRCVECGYCEPVCPSADLTLTPRQRIVLRREMAMAEATGDLALLGELRRDYQYNGIDTCAVDGMCQTACPVLIDTGELIKRLRSENVGRIEQAAWRHAAKHWSTTVRAGSLALSAAKHLPGSTVTSAAAAARWVFGKDTVPLWENDLPSGGSVRKPRPAPNPQAVFFPACIGSIFGPADGSPGVSSAFLALCDRAAVPIAVPNGIDETCCGTPWKSKGMADGYEVMAGKTAAVLYDASNGGQIPIVCDAASCTEGLERVVGNLPMVDAVAFVDQHILPRLAITSRLPSLALHPTCSTTRLDTNDALNRIAHAIADTVVVPDGWGCCAFAGDRGLLHPELTASATDNEASSVGGRRFTAYASANRTCELGMTRATGHPYHHILELLEQATRHPNHLPQPRPETHTPRVN
ncbi:FAD-binding oxidoreductase [Mycobacterium sp. DSM 3803]|nr:FAD-binding oxidoreductase [Mycobacterium sp. DSM 3803]